MKAKDVKQVYSENPEIKEIGTIAQYFKYLKTIFPDSKVQDIVYHASSNKFEEFKDPSSSGLSNVWFSENPLNDQFGENVFSVILNIKNPLNEFENKDYRKELKNYETPINPEWRDNYHSTRELPRYKHDGTVRASRVDDGKSITVRVPEQIYILGSKKDVEGFKNFVSNKKPDSLEKIVSSLFIFFSISGLAFSSLKITGNAVSQNPSYNSFLGIGLFLIGLAGFYLVKKNK
jgi:hypothetical protein